MKIIGESKKGYNAEYIITISKNELANLIGYYYGGAEGCPIFETGDELPISEIFQRLYNLKRSESNIQTVISTLSHMTDDLNLINPIIKNTEPDDGQKEG